MSVKWSKYQKKIFNTVYDTDTSIVIDAVAGSGKSTTLFHVASILQEYDSLFLAFNVHISKWAENKLGKNPNMRVQTSHSYGLSCIKNSEYKNSIFNIGKVWSAVEANTKNYKIRGRLYSVISVLRDFGCFSYTTKDLMDYVRNVPTVLTQINDAGIFSYAGEICTIMKKLDEDTTCYDFNDMMRMPIIHNLMDNGYKPEVLLVDECQDLSYYQFMFIKNILKNGARVIAVGDDKQGIYGFRGADGDALNVVQSLCKAKRLPLSISYRCKSNIVDYVIDRFEKSNDDDLPIEANADGGKVVEAAGRKEDPYALKLLVDNDITFVVSPKNKHIIFIWFTLLEEYGLPSSLKGTKITNMLTKIFKDLKSNGVVYANAEKSLRLKMASEDETEADNAASAYRFLTMQRKIRDYDSLLKLITSLDKDTKSKIHLHTVHSAKGLEAEKVFLVDDFFASDQKANMEYVACTRASDLLIIVTPFKDKTEQSYASYQAK